jgi:hypothetical protein
VLHWTDAEGVKKFPLRKPPKVTGRIRVVEVPDWDSSACGGTHARRTGEVGAIKIVGWERIRGNVRFSFLCGGRALQDHAWRTEQLLDAAKRRSSGERELIAHLERALEEREELRKQLTALTRRLFADEPPLSAHHLRASPCSPRPLARGRARIRSPPRSGAPWAISGTTAPGVTGGGAPEANTALDLGLAPELLAPPRAARAASFGMVTVAPADAAGAEAAYHLVSSAHRQ